MDERAAPSRERTRRKPSSPARIVAVAISVALLVKSTVIDLAVVDGTSMEPLLSKGSIVLVVRCAFGIRLPVLGRYILRWHGPAADSVVAAEGPHGKIVKRVFATGPAVITIAGGGLSTGDGRRVPQAAGGPEAGSILVGPGEVFLVGTNPFESVDSRTYGPLPIEKILGTVIAFGR
ncbi:MAG: signal peptidase I [Spirochaetes bacterium]|nr:signal peptidase I [Spirochaetota bacterium]